MKKFIVCTDDICPKHIDSYWKFWEEIKLEYPAFKLNAFVTPCYMQEESQLITSRKFEDWYSLVYHWVDIHIHGYDHSFPPEHLRHIDEQIAILNICKTIFESITSRPLGFKPPGYKCNEDTYKAFIKSNLIFMCLKESIYWKNLLTHTFDCGSYKLIQTHTNGICDDSIEKIKDKLISDFEGGEFYLLSDVYTSYSSIR